MTERRIDLKAGQRVIVRGPDAPGKYTSVPSVTLAEGDTALVAVADTTPTPEPEPEPTPSTGPSGILIPSVKSGWRRVGQSDFDADIPFGSWTGDPEGAMMGRASGSDTSKNGTYRLSEISQHDSLLDCRMRQLADGSRIMGCPMNKAPNPSNDSASAPRSIRVTECMKVDGPEAGWKMAHMVAKYGVVSGNEYDFPECQFNAGVTGKAYLHLHDTRPSFDSNVSPYDWHTYTIEVVSGVSVQVEIDGRVLGRATSGVTTDTLHWILQNETAMNTALPPQMGEAHVLIDWVTIDVPA